MNGFYLAIGKQGSGKSALSIKFLVDSYNETHRKVFANCTLHHIPYTRISRDKTDDPSVISILDEIKKKSNIFDNSIIFIDEIHTYFDSLDFMKNNNRIAQIFFSQLRKRNILLLGMSQYILNVDVRLRRQCMNVFDMEHIYKDLFKVSVNNIDGYFTEEISNYNIRLDGYYKYYDTDELILE